MIKFNITLASRTIGDDLANLKAKGFLISNGVAWSAMIINILPFADGFEQVTGQVEACLKFCETPRSTKEIMQYLGLSHRESFRDTILLPLIESGKIALTIPDKPNSPRQRYITVKSS